MISYNLAPIPIWPLRDNVGEPLANGYMLAYRDLVRSEFKPVYQNIAGTSVYVQPIVFNAAGFQGPFYWASDENYYLEIYDVNGQLVKTISTYNAPSSGGSGPITIVSSNKNYIVDSQFRFMRAFSFLPSALDIQLGTANWYFLKNNATAVDTIDILPFLLGSTTPPYNPSYYFQYSCTIAGTGELTKFLYHRFQSVYSFQNTEVTFGFYAKSDIGGTVLEVAVSQFFGTGGSPSTSVTIFPATFNLTTSWAQYTISFVVPSVTGKALGTNADDALQIGFKFPLDATSLIQITNIQLNNGNTLEPFEVTSDTNASTLQIPWLNAGSQRSKVLGIDSIGMLNWYSPYIFGFSFEATGPLTPLTNPFIVLPLVPGFNPNNWITGNLFRPTRPCVASFNAYYFLVSATGGVDIEIAAIFNGITIIAAINREIALPGASAQLTLPAEIGFNGTTDYLQFVGRFSGAGVAGAQLNFLFIQTF